VSFVLLILFFLMTILFCTEEGLRIITIWEYYAMGLGPLLIVLLEIVTISYFTDFSHLQPWFMEEPRMFRLVHIYVKYCLVGALAITIVVTLVSDVMNPLKLTATEQGLAWLLFIVPFTGFLLSIVFKKKQLLCCVRNQVVEGHVIDINLNIDLDSSISCKDSKEIKIDDKHKEGS
jgi:hypothetical protein